MTTESEADSSEVTESVATTPGTESTASSADAESESTQSESSTGTEVTSTGPLLDVGGMEEGGPPLVDESTCEAAAENFSSAGCDFAPLLFKNTTFLPWAVSVGNVADEIAMVTLSASDGTAIESAMVNPGEVYAFVLPEGDPQQSAHLITGSSGLFSAMRLTSDFPIVAYQFSPYASAQQASADASILLPRHAWGDEYLVGSYPGPFNGNSVDIVSLDDTNMIEVTMPTYATVSSASTMGFPALGPGQSGSFVLDEGEVLRVHVPTSDVTGVRVTSELPVQVFVDSSGLTIPDGTSYQDHVETQIPPRASWGTTFAAIKFKPRSTESDTYRFIADVDGTVIELTGDYTDTLALDRGEFVEVTTPESFYAESNEPVMLMQFMHSQSESLGPKDESTYPGPFVGTNCASIGSNSSTTHMGDPAFTYLAPVEQYRTRYLFLAPETYAWDVLTVIAPIAQWDMLTFDDAPLPEPATALGAGGLGYARFLISDGPHELDGNGFAVGAAVYGYGCRVSYAYPGGHSVAFINPPVG